MSQPHDHKGIRRDREGTSALVVHVRKNFHRALKVQAAENGTTVAATYLGLMADGYRLRGLPVPPSLEQDIADLGTSGRKQRKPRAASNPAEA